MNIRWKDMSWRYLKASSVHFKHQCVAESLSLAVWSWQGFWWSHHVKCRWNWSYFHLWGHPYTGNMKGLMPLPGLIVPALAQLKSRRILHSQSRNAMLTDGQKHNSVMQWGKLTGNPLTMNRSAKLPSEVELYALVIFLACRDAFQSNRVIYEIIELWTKLCQFLLWRLPWQLRRRAGCLKEVHQWKVLGFHNGAFWPQPWEKSEKSLEFMHWCVLGAFWPQFTKSLEKFDLYVLCVFMGILQKELEAVTFVHWKSLYNILNELEQWRVRWG